MAETVGDAILHGTFTANNLAGVREDSAKSTRHLIMDRTDGTEYPRSQAVTRYSAAFPALCSDRLK